MQVIGFAFSNLFKLRLRCNSNIFELFLKQLSYRYFPQEKQRTFKVEVMDLQVHEMFTAPYRWIKRKYSERQLWKELSSKSAKICFIL